MNRKQKAEKIGLLLDELYPSTPVPLDHKDSYTLIVAVMLSAQTTDKKVNQVTPGLFEHADSPNKMVLLPVEKIQHLIREIGLAPTKAKNVEMTEKNLKNLWNKKIWNRRHLQIIFFGREYCPARNHDMKKCQICSWASTKKRMLEEVKK